MLAIARRRLDPSVRRKEIMDAAERLLRKNGPDVRVEDVVREARAAKGTFYLYFPTWDDLLYALRARVIETFDESNPVNTKAGSKADWPRVLEQVAVAFVDAVVAMGGLHAVLYHSDFAGRCPIPEQDHPVSRLTAIVRAGQRAGAFVDIDADLVGRLLFAVMHETADAVEGGEDRRRAVATMRLFMRKALEPVSR
jgi:AcrR family transcriptional regulator